MHQKMPLAHHSRAPRPALAHKPQALPPCRLPCSCAGRSMRRMKALRSYSPPSRPDAGVAAAAAGPQPSAVPSCQEEEAAPVERSGLLPPPPSTCCAVMASDTRFASAAACGAEQGHNESIGCACIPRGGKGRAESRSRAVRMLAAWPHPEALLLHNSHTRTHLARAARVHGRHHP